MERFEHTVSQRQPLEEQAHHDVFLRMQNELLRRAGCVAEDNEKCQKGIETYAEKFRDLFESNPSLLDRWRKDEESALQEIEIDLYGRKDEEHAAQ